MVMAVGVWSAGHRGTAEVLRIVEHPDGVLEVALRQVAEAVQMPGRLRNQALEYGVRVEVWVERPALIRDLVGPVVDALHDPESEPLLAIHHPDKRRARVRVVGVSGRQLHRLVEGEAHDQPFAVGVRAGEGRRGRIVRVVEGVVADLGHRGRRRVLRRHHEGEAQGGFIAAARGVVRSPPPCRCRLCSWQGRRRRAGNRARLGVEDQPLREVPGESE